MRKSNSPDRTLPPRYWRIKPIQWVVIDLNDWLFRFIAINVLWVLLSMTVILLPPATAALYEAAYQAYRGQPPDARRFFTSMKSWFWRSWAWALANGLIVGGLFLLGRASLGSEIVLAILAVILVLLVIGQFYFWAYAVIQESPTISSTLRNSVFTAFGDLLYVTLYLALVLVLLIPSLLLIVPFLLIAPFLFASLSVYSLIGWLQHHQLLKTEAREL